MSQLRERLIQDLQVRGRSAHTIRSYVTQVWMLAKHYRCSPDQLSMDEVQAYLAHLLTVRHLAPNSCILAAHALRFFYHVTLGKPHPHFVIPVPRKPRTLPIILSQQEVVRLFEAAPNLKTKTLLMTTYGAGLRVSEVTHLKDEDIDSDRMVLWVRGGKGSKDRGVGLSSRLLEALRVYWRAYHPPRGWLFPSPHNINQPLTRAAVRYGLRSALKRAEIRKACCPHSLRHSYATHLLENGKDLRTIQVLLGHKYISSTLVYIHLAQGSILEADSPLDLLDWKSG